MARKRHVQQSLRHHRSHRRIRRTAVFCGDQSPDGALPGLGEQWDDKRGCSSCNDGSAPEWSSGARDGPVHDRCAQAGHLGGPSRLEQVAHVDKELREAVAAKFGDCTNLLCATKPSVPSGIALYLGHVSCNSEKLTGAYHVYKADTGAEHDDVFLHENVTLKNTERRQLLNSLHRIDPSKTDWDPKIYMHLADGNFNAVDMFIMPDQHIVDMSKLFDFSFAPLPAIWY